MQDTATPLLHAFTVFMGFFAIMNPIANVPIFLSLTSGDDEKTTTTVALRSVLLAFLIVTAFSIAGKLIFDLFGLTLPAFRIAGGLVVFLIGFKMLQGDPSACTTPRKKISSNLRRQRLVSPSRPWPCPFSPARAPLRQP